MEVTLVTMTRYEASLPALVCYEPVPLTNVLAEVLAKNGQHQFHCAETEKYAHVASSLTVGASSHLTEKSAGWCHLRRSRPMTCNRQ